MRVTKFAAIPRYASIDYRLKHVLEAITHNLEVGTGQAGDGLDAWASKRDVEAVTQDVTKLTVNSLTYGTWALPASGEYLPKYSEKGRYIITCDQSISLSIKNAAGAWVNGVGNVTGLQYFDGGDKIKIINLTAVAATISHLRID